MPKEYLSEQMPTESTDVELTHKLIALFLEQFFSHLPEGETRKPTNQGNNGLIYRLSPKDQQGFPPITGESATENQGDIAAKILKVYTVGSAEKEYTYQQKAFDVLKTAAAKMTDPHGESLPLAAIPHTTDFGTIRLDQSAQENIRNYGTLVGDKAEYILMDYIVNKKDGVDSSPAPDLAAFYAKAVVRYYQGNALSEEEIATMSTNEALQEAFRYIGGAWTPIHEENKDLVWNQNKKRFYNHVRMLLKNHKLLTEHGMVLTENDITSLIAQVANSVESLHVAGIYHNDLHERNILIQELVDTETKKNRLQAFIIDFGSAESEEATDRIKDDHAVEQLRQLLKKDEVEIVKQNFLDAINTIAVGLDHPDPSNKSLYSIKELLRGTPDTILQSLFPKLVINDPQNGAINFLGVLKHLVTHNMLTSQQAQDFCTTILEKSKLPPKKGRTQPAPQLRIDPSTRNRFVWMKSYFEQEF